MSAVPVPDIHETEVDGVPILWSAAPGPLTAALQFRVGRIDERPAIAGITHLVEHMAVVPLGQPRYEHNAFVELARTVFFASGRPTDVTAFIGSVVASLHQLPTERLDVERVILKRESDGRETGPADLHLQHRFGLSAHGLAAYPEFGLGAVTGDQVQAWASDHFTAGNATAWLTGPPPAGFTIPLPTGARRPVPPAQPLTSVRWPSHIQPGQPGVGLGFDVPRRRGSGTLVAILERRLRRRLRYERGLVYDVVSDYEPLTAEVALGMVGADCQPGDAQQVVDIVLEEIESLRHGNATADELGEAVTDIEEGMDDPTAIGGLLDILVSDRLLGMPPRTPAEMYEEQHATTAEDVAAAAEAAWSSALLIADVPKPPPGFTPYPYATDPVKGREVKPFLSVLGIGPKQRLIIGPEGVSLRLSDGHVTVRYADCAILEKPVDDGLVMWGRDGTRIYVPAAFWRGGEGVIAEIERNVPPEIVVREKFSEDYFD